MRVTLSVIKADVGSVGGHTMPSAAMVGRAKQLVADAVKKGLLLDGMVTYTGDDIALIMSHQHGTAAAPVHNFAWDVFLQATAIARSEGNYGAGQDLLVDAPSGNVRGAGPAVAEISFELLPKHRPAEAFMVFAADKCAPGAYNLPLYLSFCDPMHNGGLLLSPVLHKGFTVTVIDMDHRGKEDRVIKLNIPEQVWDLAALIRDEDRFAIEAIHSRVHPDEQIVSVAATRLHNVAGKYTGKDDPVALVRVQSLFPAPEELVEPWATIHQIVTGDCRGSHNMPIMPTAINQAVTGPYCLPIVSSLGFSLNKEGKFSSNYVDFFGGEAFDYVRHKVQEKAVDFRRQGFFGVAMASKTELAYTGLTDTLTALDKKFEMRRDDAAVSKESRKASKDAKDPD
ncbi:MAG: fructose 1,6-bisphosphatase [SAR202 cluster bacterium]|nr:fructose 1,6-bisphosphatase [SAR202 cluster bacterium]